LAASIKAGGKSLLENVSGFWKGAKVKKVKYIRGFLGYLFQILRIKNKKGIHSDLIKKTNLSQF